MQFFSGNLSRGWRRRKLTTITHIPGCICRFTLGISKSIKKRTETLYQSFSPFMVEHRGVSSRASTALGQPGSEAPLGPHSSPGQVRLPYFLYHNKNHPSGWFFVMVEHRGVSSRASTALGQPGSEAPLGPHSSPGQVRLPYFLYHNKNHPSGWFFVMVEHRGVEPLTF